MNAAYLTPAITLFHEDGSLDFESQEHLFNNLIENGVDGILVEGSSSEFFAMPMDQRREMAKFAIETVNRRVKLIIGTSHMVADEIVNFSNFCLDAGADAVMILPPYYFHFGAEALLQYYEPRNAEKVVKALKMTHREDLIPLLVPAAGRRAVQRSARRAEAADVTIHNDGTYTVRPNQKGHNGKPAHGQSRAAAPTGRAPSPGARFAPHSAPARKPKNDQQKENTTWKTGKKKK